MNRNGMIITSLLYAILVLFIMLLFSIVMTISIRKTLVDGISKKLESDFINNAIDPYKPVITGSSILPVFSGQTFVAADYKNGLTAIDPQDGDISSYISCTMPSTTIECTVTDANGNVSDKFYRTTLSVTQLTYSYNGSYQTFVAPNAGTYRIQLWGAQGGSSSYALGGAGAYTAGNVALTDGQKLYIYVGAMPQKIEVAYNGGAASANIAYSRSGGGATDVRVTPGLWNDTQSLRSRIMVAAGGGGTSAYSTTGAVGGYGGALTGGPGILAGSGTYTLPGGGTQTSGGTAGIGTATASAGTFGTGGANLNGGGAGGGGYYGGGGGTVCTTCSLTGAGGSSFISGYTGCNAVNASGTHTGTPNHYSGLIFNTMTMSAGNVSIPTQDGASTQTGNSYGGYAKITWVSN